ncbi:transcriptional regulator [Lacticaseibacillus zeae DSM 20178 = KCTC 3804]|uniref:Transcriptional regulator n=1 Tax=Lacticaseibacillus zeae DSM 20178 = KCTC 3804 TaxID=1423816 RepID=A0A0R1EZZ6_LACZE|nr:GntR family transcriptional regulator YhfZ [Lacticaseibacillus zeae]KRK12474.1 transcriptional regulator [Lacticaseibacillus zeae DSM 20178 = KCTC 3804]
MRAYQYQKKGLALIFLAKKFFVLKVGDRIPTVTEMINESGLSRGTIQAGLELMKDDGAISTVSKGHLGSFLVTQDQDKLLSYLDYRSVVCAMPLPYTKHYEGLGTGLYSAFKNQKMGLNIAYVNGSVNRLEGLKRNRYDFIIASALTADYLVERHDVDVVGVMPEGSYVSKHVIVYRGGHNFRMRDGLRIGIDSHSLDYKLMTNKILEKHRVKLVESPYNQIVQRIVSGEIDAAIWNLDEVKSKNYPLSYQLINDPMVKRASQAAILCVKGNEFVKRVIGDYVDFKEVTAIQKQVISGEVLPEY